MTEIVNSSAYAASSFVAARDLDHFEQMTFQGVLDELRYGDVWKGLDALASPEVLDWPVEQRQRLVQAALARLKTERADNPEAQAKALATVALILHLVETGAISPSMFAGSLETELTTLINHLAGLEDLPAVANQVERHGASKRLKAFVDRLDLRNNTLPEIGLAIMAQARIDPRDVEDGHHVDTNRFVKAKGLSPDAGITAVIQLIGNIEQELDALIRSLEAAGGDASQGILASIKGRMEVVQMMLDVAWGLLDQFTKMLERAGQAFNR